MVGTLYTFGYAGLNSATDLRARLGERPNVVVDVRMKASSGNRAFSAATRRTVEDAGYSYRRLDGLGNAAYRTGGTRFARPEEIGTLVDLLNSGANVAIMCACSEVMSCHRRLVADLTAARLPGLTVADL